MKNITMFENVESLKNAIKSFRLVTEYEFFNVLVFLIIVGYLVGCHNSEKGCK